jgi:hypothetical protein
MGSGDARRLRMREARRDTFGCLAWTRGKAPKFRYKKSGYKEPLILFLAIKKKNQLLLKGTYGGKLARLSRIAFSNSRRLNVRSNLSL